MTASPTCQGATQYSAVQNPDMIDLDFNVSLLLSLKYALLLKVKVLLRLYWSPVDQDG